MCKHTIFTPILILTLLLALPVSAGSIIYVDVTEGETGNTTLATGEILQSTSDASGTDNLWRSRAFGNASTILEAGGDNDGSNTEDCPRLMTSVVVPEGDYEVFAYFWSDSTNWCLAASLTDAPNMPLYIANDPNSEAIAASPTDFNEPTPLVSEDNRTLWKISLGTTGLTDVISVYVDDDPNHETVNSRTWYDGIGYQPKSPGITYVDAESALDPNVLANTFLVTGEDFLPVDVSSGGSGSDGLWRIRYNFSNGGTIFESRGDWGADNSEDCPRLMTSVEVPEGMYEVYAYMWTAGGENYAAWRLGASLTNDVNELPAYVCGNSNGESALAVAEDFNEPVPMVTESDRTLWQIPLGTTAVDVNSAITVYIDDVLSDSDTASGGNARTWYDGIGYKPFKPTITYIDATDGEEGNTLLSTGEVFEPVDDVSGSDNLWRKRAFSNEGTVYESGGDWQADGNTEDCPRLMTFVEVPEGVYDVYAYCWSDGSPWPIAASLTDDEGELPLYETNDPNGAATAAVADHFENSVMVAEGNRLLWQVYLGETDLTNIIQVYIDDEPNHLAGSRRTWYDGIGYMVKD